MKKEERIAILQEVTQIKSVNENESEVAAYLSKLLAKHDITEEIVSYRDGRDNLIARYQKDQSGKVLGLSGHTDVVTAGDGPSWTYVPFAVEIHGSRLYGRGVTDMRSGSAAMVIAMIELKESGGPFNGAAKLLATAGGEVGELGGEQLTRAGYVDDLDTLITGELTNYSSMYTYMGSISYTVTSYGKEARSSMPNQGYNVINRLDEFIAKANTEMDHLTEIAENPILGRTIHNVTLINGGNQVNSIPSHAQLQRNIRSIPEHPNDKIIALLQSTVNELDQRTDYHLELMINYNKMPVKADSDSLLIYCIQRQFNQPLPLAGTAATMDTAEFAKANHSPDLIVFGSGVVALPYQVDEYVEIDSCLDMTEKYQGIILSYLT